MVKGTLDQYLKSQVKAEIGEEEDMKFPRKNMLNMKYGVTPAGLVANELAYWEMRAGLGDLSDVFEAHTRHMRGDYAT